MENEDCIHLCIVAFSIEVKDDGIIFTGLFNNQAYHSPPLTLAMVDTVLFKSVSGPEASLTVSNKPQPYSSDKGHEDVYVVIFIRISHLKYSSPALADCICITKK